MEHIVVHVFYGGLGRYVCAQCSLSNISINEFLQFFAGAKGGDAWN